MLDYFNLFRALQTDQFDDITVRQLKAAFNTEPDVENIPVLLLPEGLNERRGMSIMAHAMGTITGQGCVVVVGGNVSTPQPIPIKNFVIEPLIEPTKIFENNNQLRDEKQQNKYRSRNHKK